MDHSRPEIENDHRLSPWPHQSKSLFYCPSRDAIRINLAATERRIFQTPGTPSPTLKLVYLADTNNRIVKNGSFCDRSVVPIRDYILALLVGSSNLKFGA